MLAALTLALGGARAAHADPLTWTAPEQIDPANPAAINAVSCPSASLCLGADASGDLVTSTNPTGGAGVWVTSDIDGAGAAGGFNSLSGMSCPSSSFCAAVDENGDVLWTTDPTHPASRWSSVTALDSNPFTAISCPSASLCVAVDDAGNAYTSTNP
ncbi:MAG TPA: hypothetical protein VIK04_17350, partial [Solirubrobacteraceae bacterium]